MKTIGHVVSRKAALILLIGILAILPAYATAANDPYLITEFRRYMIFAMVAVSLDLILGYGGMVCFGQAMFFGVGAYAAAIYGQQIGQSDALLMWIVGASVSACVAAIVGLVSLRTTGIYFIMITLAFAQLSYFVFVGVPEWGGDEGLKFTPSRTLLGLVDLHDQVTFYYVVFVVLFGLLYVLHRLVRSRFGIVIQGSKENDRRMRGLGYDTFWYRLLCFVIAGAIAGFAGGLFASNEGFVSPSIMAWGRSGELIVMVLIGGATTLVGPVFGTIVFLLMESFLPEYSEHWMLFFGPLLVVIVLAFGRGLYGSLRETEPLQRPSEAMEHRNA